MHCTGWCYQVLIAFVVFLHPSSEALSLKKDAIIVYIKQVYGIFAPVNPIPIKLLPVLAHPKPKATPNHHRQSAAKKLCITPKMIYRMPRDTQTIGGKGIGVSLVTGN
jgi:hypothetical protein